MRNLIYRDRIREKKSTHHFFVNFEILAPKNYIENNTWGRGNTRFISSVEHDISQVSAANE